MMLRVEETEWELDVRHIPAYARHLQTRTAVPPGPEENVPGRWDLNGLLRDYQRQLLQTALNQSKGNITQAAASLGIGRQNLLARMKRLGIAK